MLQEFSLSNRIKQRAASLYSRTSNIRTYVLIGEFEINHFDLSVSIVRKEDQKTIFQEPKPMSHIVRAEKLIEFSTESHRAH